jgi:hypothetical protein
MIGEGDSEKEAIVVQAGRPRSGNGVWVLKYKAKDLNARLRVQLHKLASNMDERCQVIKELGGSFFEDPGACDRVLHQLKCPGIITCLMRLKG